MHPLRHALQALMVLLTITSAQAQSSQQPIRIVFPSPAGGAGDALVRMLAESMQGSLGRSVIVENKAGAGGRIGVQAEGCSSRWQRVAGHAGWSYGRFSSCLRKTRIRSGS